MFGMGMPEILLILAIALIVIGPKKLPDLAKSMGKAFGEFKRATQDFKQAMDIDKDLTSVKRTFDDIDLNKIAETAAGTANDTAAETATTDSVVKDPAPPEKGAPLEGLDSSSAAAKKDAGPDGHA